MEHNIKLLKVGAACTNGLRAAHALPPPGKRCTRFHRRPSCEDEHLARDAVVEGMQRCCHDAPPCHGPKSCGGLIMPASQPCKQGARSLCASTSGARVLLCDVANQCGSANLTLLAQP